MLDEPWKFFMNTVEYQNMQTYHKHTVETHLTKLWLWEWNTNTVCNAKK